MGRNAQSQSVSTECVQCMHRICSVRLRNSFRRKAYFIFQEGKLKLPLRENFKILQRKDCRLAPSLDKMGGSDHLALSLHKIGGASEMLK